MNQLAPVADTSLENVAEKVQSYINNSKATSTIKAYKADWSHFTSWCDTLYRHCRPSPAL